MFPDQTDLAAAVELKLPQVGIYYLILETENSFSSCLLASVELL